MELATVLMGLGIALIILTFFMKDSSKKVERDVEELSINIYQETNALKRRLKVIEEELLLEPNFQLSTKPKVPQAQATAKPIHSILISQVHELNKQGYNIDEITQRSALSAAQVREIIGGKL